MATMVVSGRVDLLDARRAQIVIERAGTTPGEVIRTLWHNIAETEELPQDQDKSAERQAAFDKLMELRDSLPSSPWLANLTDDEMRDYLTDRLEKKYA